MASITGGNFSSWYNGEFGTFFIDMKRLPYYTSGAFMEIFDNAGPFLSDIGNNFTIRTGTENNAYVLGQYATNVDYKIGVSYLNQTNYSVSSNGSVVTTAASVTDLTTATEWHIGRGNNAYTANYRIGPSNAHWKRLTYYPVRLPDATLQAITAP